MLKISVVCLYFAVVTVNFWNANSIPEEKIKAITETIKPIAEKCASHCGLNGEDFKECNKDDDNMDPCFKSCFSWKLGHLDEAGKCNRDALHELIARYKDYAEKAIEIEDQFDSCFDKYGKNDGEDEACQLERVFVLFKCLKEIEE